MTQEEVVANESGEDTSSTNTATPATSLLGDGTVWHPETSQNAWFFRPPFVARPLLPANMMNLSNLALVLASLVLGCASSSTVSTPQGAGSTSDGGATSETTGLGTLCPDAGCASARQSCVTSTGPEGEMSTCEIKCTANEQCPSGFKCNLPPIVPDSLPNVCVN